MTRMIGPNSRRVSPALLLLLGGCAGILGRPDDFVCTAQTDPSKAQANPSTAQANPSVTCGQQAVVYALRQCQNRAAGLQKNKIGWFNSNVAEVFVSAVSLGLGASSIAAAKAWGTFGGATALSTPWHTDTATITTDDKAALEVVNGIITQVPKHQTANATDDQALKTQMLADAASCIAATAPSPAAVSAAAASAAADKDSAAADNMAKIIKAAKSQ